jgi:hypothetical protein
MTPEDFRRITLALDGAGEGAHMGHPDFRVSGRVFASLHDGNKFGMVALTPEQQQEFLSGHPDVFAPEAGAWGRAGYTRVRLEAAHEEVVGEALTLAWQKAMRKGSTNRSKRKR